MLLSQVGDGLSAESEDAASVVIVRTPGARRPLFPPTPHTLIKIDYDTGENRAYRTFDTREAAEEALEALRPFIEHAYPTCHVEGDGTDGLLIVTARETEHVADYLVAEIEEHPQNFA